VTPRSAFCDFPSQPDITLVDLRWDELDECAREISTLWILLLWMTFGLVQGTIVALEIFGALIGTDETG
jgi:hypothetical protein